MQGRTERAGISCLNPRHPHTLPTVVATLSPLCPIPGCGFLLSGTAIERWQVTALLRQSDGTDFYSARSLTTKTHARSLVKMVRDTTSVSRNGLELLRQLRHTHIHPLYAVRWFEGERALCLLSPYEERGSLVRYLQASGRLPLPVVMQLTLQIADALYYAHSLSVVHGHLKPENCLLVSPTALQVSDFYTTLLLPQRLYQQSHFSAPEQRQGWQEPASDQYALALIVYCMLSGSYTALMQAPKNGLLTSTLRPLSSLRADLPRQVDGLLRQALHLQPEERFPSIRAFVQALRSVLQLAAATATPLERPPAVSLILPPDTLSSQPPPTPPPSKGARPGIQRITPLSYLPGHTAPITALHWSHDGQYLASTSLDQSLRVWSLQRRIGTPYAALPNLVKKIYTLQWSPVAPLLAVAYADGTLQLCSLADSTLQNVRSWLGHDGGVTALAWSPDGSYLVSGGADRVIRVWDQMGKLLNSWHAHKRGGVTALAWSPALQQLASGGADRRIFLWNPANAQLLHAYPEIHHDEIRTLAWSNSDYLASSAARRDTQVCLWDGRSGDHLMTFTGQKREVVGIFWTPQAEMLGVVGTDKTLRLWPIDPASSLNELQLPLPEVSQALAVAPRQELLALGMVDMQIVIFQLT